MKADIAYKEKTQKVQMEVEIALSLPCHAVYCVQEDNGGAMSLLEITFINQKASSVLSYLCKTLFHVIVQCRPELPTALSLYSDSIQILSFSVQFEVIYCLTIRYVVLQMA